MRCAMFEGSHEQAHHRICSGARCWFAGAMRRSQAPTAQEILAGVDKVRNPGQPFRLTNTLVEYINGKPRDRVVLVVFAKRGHADPAVQQSGALCRAARATSARWC